MTDHTLPPELAREAALARIRRAKDAFTRVSVDYLRGEVNPDAVAAAIAEVDAARAALRMLDQQDEAKRG